MLPSSSFRNRFERADAAPSVRGVGPSSDSDLTTEEVALLIAWRQARSANVENVRSDVIVAADIVIDRAARTVTRAGRMITLSPKEYELLTALALRPDIAVPRALLMNEVWNQPMQQSSRTLDQHVAQLRHKIEDDPKAPAYILTVSKYGYRFNSRRLRIAAG